MEWQATDQFGNLYVGVSEASSFEELRSDLASLVEQLQARSSEQVVITIDMEYQEINGPDPEKVSHVLQVAWLQSQSGEDIRELVASELSESGVEIRIA